MNRGSFLKGLFGGAIALSSIPTSANITKNEKSVKKLTDEQLNELYNAYFDLKNREKQKELKAKTLYENSIIEIKQQYSILKSLNFLYIAFYNKNKKSINKLTIKKHIKILENYMNWLEDYFNNNKSKYYVSYSRNTRDLDYIMKVDITIAIVKGYLLIGNIQKANDLFYEFCLNRNFGSRESNVDDYALIYYGDLYFKSGFKKQSLQWYNQSNKDRIVRWVKKLEENSDDKDVLKEFNKRYYSKSYFGYMIYDRDNIYIKSNSNYKALEQEFNKIKNKKYEFDVDDWI